MSPTAVGVDTGFPGRDEARRRDPGGHHFGANAMLVYVLTFDSRPSLTRAFDLVLSSPDVTSCMIEADRARIRFMAPEPYAEKVVEQIYMGRGLVWCSRHSVVSDE